MIEVFDNRLEISSPGGLPKGLKEEDFGKRTLARNPLVAALLNRAGYIEKLGTGIPRIRQSMLEAGLPEPDFKFDSFFTVVLARPSEPPTPHLFGELTVPHEQLERMKFLLQQLVIANKLEVAAAAKKLGTTERTVRRDLMALNKMGWIGIEGSTRNRTYRLTEQALKKLSEK
jgi:ATP-dependent DNA helicase RecG